jgi:hypothetical protein
MAPRESKPDIETAGIIRRENRITRRAFLEKGSVSLAGIASLSMAAGGQQTPDMSGDNHQGANETQSGPRNRILDLAEPDSVYSPKTDAGGRPTVDLPVDSLCSARSESERYLRWLNPAEQNVGVQAPTIYSTTHESRLKVWLQASNRAEQQSR